MKINGRKYVVVDKKVKEALGKRILSKLAKESPFTLKTISSARNLKDVIGEGVSIVKVV